MIMADVLSIKTCSSNNWINIVYAVRALYTVAVTVFTFCTRQNIDSKNLVMHICSSVLKNNLRKKIIKK